MRRSVCHQICSKPFSFIARQIKGDTNQAVLIPKGVLRINQALKLLTLGSWGPQLELGTGTHQENTRAEVFTEKGHFFSTLPSPTQYQWTCSDSAGRNQVSEGKHSESEIRSMPKIGESERTWTAQAWTTKQGHKWEWKVSHEYRRQQQEDLLAPAISIQPRRRWKQTWFVMSETIYSLLL